VKKGEDVKVEPKLEHDDSPAPKEETSSEPKGNEMAPAAAAAEKIPEPAPSAGPKNSPENMKFDNGGGSAGKRERRRGPPVGYAMGPAGSTDSHSPRGGSLPHGVRFRGDTPRFPSDHAGGRGGRGDGYHHSRHSGSEPKQDVRRLLFFGTKLYTIGLSSNTLPFHAHVQAYQHDNRGTKRPAPPPHEDAHYNGGDRGGGRGRGRFGGYRGGGDRGGGRFEGGRFDGGRGGGGYRGRGPYRGGGGRY
jgi:hypothetical protein